MVMFHSYVSLPEGKSVARETRDPHQRTAYGLATEAERNILYIM